MTERRRYAARLAGAVLMAMASASHAASFDCKKAGREVEKLICGDPELDQLDLDVARLYRQVRSSLLDDEPAVEEQRRWLREVRDRCTSVDCLKAAYQRRVNSLYSLRASFDCGKARTRAESWICASDSMQLADNMMAQAYEGLASASPDVPALRSEQGRWRAEVRDKCADESCLSFAIRARTDDLRKRKEQLVADIARRAGYQGDAHVSDARTWPGDSRRIIAVFAREDRPSGDHLDIDVFVLDSATFRVLQHGKSSTQQDAARLDAISIEPTDFARTLGAPVFGLRVAHRSYGCFSYTSETLRLHAAEGRAVRAILGGVVLTEYAGMCGEECETLSLRRELRPVAGAPAPYPTLAVREKRTEVEQPAQPGGRCRASVSRREHELRFDGRRYVVPKELGN